MGKSALMRALLFATCTASVACGSDGGSAITKDGDGGTLPGESNGSSNGPNTGDDTNQTGDRATSVEGVWVATAEPDQLLRFEGGSDKPADTIALQEDPSFVEIIDGVAFYLKPWGEVLYFHDLKSGDHGEIALAGDSALDGLVFADGSLWVADEANDAVWRIHPKTREVVGGTVLGIHDTDGTHDGLALAATESDVYVGSLFGSPDVVRLGITSGKVDATGQGGDGTTGIAFGADAAWVTSRFDGTLWRLHPDDLTLVKEIKLGADLSAQTRNVGVGAGAVWVVAGVGGNAQDIFGQEAKPGVYRVDPATNEAVIHIPFKHPLGLRTTEDAIWIMTEEAAVQLDPETNAVARMLTPGEGKVRDIILARTGGGTGSTNGKEKIDVYTVVEPPAVVCEELTPFHNEATGTTYGTGTATLTVDGKVTTLGNGTCMTLRDTTGKVVNYLASFANDLPEPSAEAFVRIYDAYSGNGTYTAELSYDGEPGASDEESTLIITKGGLHGVAANADGSTLEFDCDADAKVSLETIQPTAPKPGEAIVHTKNNINYHFYIDCSSDVLSDELLVKGPTQFASNTDHTLFELTTSEPAEAGEHEANLDFTFFGATFTAEKGTLTLVCDKHVNGTFTSENYEAVFTCN